MATVVVVRDNAAMGTRADDAIVGPLWIAAGDHAPVADAGYIDLKFVYL